MDFDRLFKLALLAILLGLFFIGWSMKENGRYVFHPQLEGDTARVIDSRTGTVFLVGASGSVEVHPYTGETVIHDMWFQGKQPPAKK